jgi:hypothetical protein
MAAVTGVVLAAASATKSFIDAGKQRSLQKQAQEDASKAMAEARAKLEKNFYDEMAVKKEPYELEREAMLAQGAQAIDAAQEQERGAAAAAGKVQMAMNEGQAGIRTAMGREMTEIERLKLAEDSRLRDVNVQLDLSEAEGAQLAARDAGQAAAAATEQGFQSLQSGIQQGIKGAELYKQDRKAQREAAQKQAQEQQKQQALGGMRGAAGMSLQGFGIGTQQAPQPLAPITTQQQPNYFTPTNNPFSIWNASSSFGGR